jgi:hypothetical protein
MNFLESFVLSTVTFMTLLRLNNKPKKMERIKTICIILFLLLPFLVLLFA